MPAIKKRTSRLFSYRDFWGDGEQGESFDRLIDRKFGTHHGARVAAVKFLGYSRRLLNMYVTGERRIPDEIWAKVKARPDYLDDDGVDPLS